MIKRPYQCGIAVYQLAKLRMLEFYYDFLDKFFSRQDFELCYMAIDSFYLAISVDLLDDIVRPETRQAYEADKKLGSQKTNLAREHLVYLSLSLWVQLACDLLQSATLFKMRPMKINIAEKVFQRSIMICIFSAIKMPWMFF